MLDMGSIMAEHLAKERGGQRRHFWLDSKTVSTLRDTCASVIISVWRNDAPIFYPKLSERHIEFRFGRIRTSFGNCQMGVSDYWRASLRLMLLDQKKRLPPQVESPVRLTEQEFDGCAKRAFNAVRKLMAFCTKKKEKEVASIFTMGATSGLCELDEADLDCEDETGQ